MITGKTWVEKAGTIQGETLKCYGKIKAKNLTMTINGKTYTDIIYSYIEIRKYIAFLPITVYQADYYVAQNIGIVERVSKQTLTGTGIPVTTSITNYSIK